MNEVPIAKLMHLLLLVYWLGADVGTFYAARFVANAELTVAARATAARIMLGIDIAPRLCMPLTLATGWWLAIATGALPLPRWTLWAVVAGCAFWLAMVLVLHYGQGKGTASSWTSAVVRIDWAFRCGVVFALAAWLALSWQGSAAPLAPWLMLKLACFALTVLCGLMIRIHLKPFGAAFGVLMRAGPDAAINQVIASSIARCVPYVVAIWVLLVVAAAAGLHLLG